MRRRNKLLVVLGGIIVVTSIAPMHILFFWGCISFITTDFARNKVWNMEYKEGVMQEATPEKIKYLSSIKGLPSTLRRSIVRNAFDILSIGSSKRLGLLRAQAQTFGRSISVGHFFAATESDDVNTSCDRNLSLEDVVRKINHCKMRWRGTSQTPIMNAFRIHSARKQWLEKKKNPIGWYCAQSRPPLALANLLRHYRLSYERDGENSLPLYLLLIDDDTYIH